MLSPVSKSYVVARLRVQRPLWRCWTPLITLWNWPKGPSKISLNVTRYGMLKFFAELLTQKKNNGNLKKPFKVDKLWHKKARNLLQVGNIQNFEPLKKGWGKFSWTSWALDSLSVGLPERWTPWALDSCLYRNMKGFWNDWKEEDGEVYTVAIRAMQTAINPNSVRFPFLHVPGNVNDPSFVPHNMTE